MGRHPSNRSARRVGLSEPLWPFPWAGVLRHRISGSISFRGQGSWLSHLWSCPRWVWKRHPILALETLAPRPGSALYKTLNVPACLLSCKIEIT